MVYFCFFFFYYYSYFKERKFDFSSLLIYRISRFFRLLWKKIFFFIHLFNFFFRFSVMNFKYPHLMNVYFFCFFADYKWYVPAVCCNYYVVKFGILSFIWKMKLFLLFLQITTDISPSFELMILWSSSIFHE